MKSLRMLLVIVCLAFSGCAQSQVPALQVGIIEGLGDDILAEVQKNAAAQGLNFEIVTFKDYTEINTALKQKKIDINCFQDKYWLDNTNQNRQTDFVSIGKTYLAPLGGYSKRHQSLKDLPQKAAIALPDDNYSMARALLLLEQAGLIRLEETNFLPVLEDITQNDKKLALTPVSTTKIRSLLNDFDLVFMGINYATSIDLNAADALLLEQPAAEASQLLVVRSEDKNRPEILRFLKIYQSEQTRDFINKKYNGNLIPAW